MKIALSILVCSVVVVSISAQTTEFTYQGSLKEGVNLANGNYDFEFVLYNALSGGIQVGSPVTRSSVTVSSGIFSVSLDFGDQYSDGIQRYLEIRVRPAGGGSFSALSPRQQLDSAPFAVESIHADTSINASWLGNVPANQYVLTTDPRLTDARPPTAGSASYVQNTTSAQASSNFNISGNGTAGGTLGGNIVNATSQYNLNNNRILSEGVGGSGNLFLGQQVGQITTGTVNTFVGTAAGSANTLGHDNAFFGTSAGNHNTSGFFNTFFGPYAGVSNTTGSFNTFFGMEAGIGTLGSHNAFFGATAGDTNTAGTRNTIIGDYADVEVNNLTNATALGANAVVGASNSLVLGSINGVNSATADTNVGIGTTTPKSRLHLHGNSSNFALTFTNSANSMNFQGYRIAFDNNRLTFQRGQDDGTYASDQIAIDPGTGSLGIGTVAPLDKLHVVGKIRVSSLGADGFIPLCLNASNQISTCSTSLRYETNIGRFGDGMSFVNKPQRITFDWKQGGMKDAGFEAEDVEKIDTRFVTYNDKGEVEGVKYDRIGVVVLVNAIKEQQSQIESLKNANAQQRSFAEAQQKQIEMLTQALCSLKPELEICKSNR